VLKVNVELLENKVSAETMVWTDPKEKQDSQVCKEMPELLVKSEQQEQREGKDGEESEESLDHQDDLDQQDHPVLMEDKESQAEQVTPEPEVWLDQTAHQDLTVKQELQDPQETPDQEDHQDNQDTEDPEDHLDHAEHQDQQCKST